MKKRLLLLSMVTVMATVSVPLQVDAAPAVFLKYKQELSAELAGLQDEICTTFSMSSFGWKAYKQSWNWGVQYKYDRCIAGLQLAGKGLSARFKAIANNLFKRLNISGTVYNAKDYIDPNETDPAKKDPNLYYGTSDGNCAYIDEETMTRCNLSNSAIEATILHELVHIVMEYSLASFTLQKLIEKTTDPAIKAKGQQILRKLRHLHEKIADIFAGLAGGIGVAQALVGVYSRGSSPATETHPALSSRAAYMQAVCAAMQADPYYSTGVGYGNALSERLPYC